MSYAPIQIFKTKKEAIAYIEGWTDAIQLNAGYVFKKDVEKRRFTIFKVKDGFEVNYD